MTHAVNTSVTPELNSRLIPEWNIELAEQLNDEMRYTVMPVTVIVGIEAVLGFCGNLMILYVFLFHYHKCNFKYFVLCLSFIDTIGTLTTLPGEIVTQMFWYVCPDPYICKVKSFFNMFTVFGSALVLLVISIDRFRKVCRPFEWQIKPNIAITLIFLVLLVSFIVSMPVPFFWGIHSYLTVYKGRNITVTVCEIDGYFQNSDYPLAYTILIEVTLSSILFVMFVLYMLVCKQIVSVRSKRKRAKNTEYCQSPQVSGLTSSSEKERSDTERETPLDSTDSRRVYAVEVDKKSCVPPLETNVLKQFSQPRAKRMSSRSISKKMVRKTLIMLILTTVFIVTTVLYLTLLSLISDNILEQLNEREKAVYFFFFRLYFINQVINPILYGILDARFRIILKRTFLSDETL